MAKYQATKKVIFIDGDKTNIVLENLQVWNAGMKGWQAGGNSVKTQFKKGQLPHNTRKDGDERVNKDGYTEVRIAKAKWMLKHRLVYQEHHKVTLETHEYVSFKDGNRKNFAIDNLELKTRAEMMTKNTLHQYPPELKEVILELSKVKKTIKKKSKDGKDKKES